VDRAVCPLFALPLFQPGRLPTSPNRAKLENVTKLLCVITLTAASVVAQTVEGTVINSVTGDGISGVKVTIQAGTTVYTPTTDAKGRFALDNVPDGSYLAR